MPGSPTADGNLRRRVSRMEKLVEAITEQLDDALRVSVPSDFRDIHIARTARKPGGSYPSTGQTFWVEFLDGYFTDNSGNQAATWETLGIDDGVHAHNIDDEHVDEGTIVFAVWQAGTNSETDGEWWFQKLGSSASGLFLCNFTLTSSLALGGTASATVGSCSDSVATIFSSTITVEDVIGKFKGKIGYKGMAWKYQSDTACNWQIVELEEQAEVIQAILTDANPFSGAIGDTANADVDDYWQGEDPGLTVVVEDRAGLYGDLLTNSRVLASYDEIDDIYVVIDAKQAPAADEACEKTAGRGEMVDPAWDRLNGQTVWPIDKIRLNRDTLMRGFYDDFNEIFLIGIDVAEYENSVVWSQADRINWSDGPLIGHNVTVGGTQGALKGNSYIRIKGNALANEIGIWTFAVGFESDADEQVWIMPSNRPTDHNCHVITEKTGFDNVPSEPECLQLKWTAQGKDGYFEFPTNTSHTESCRITLEAGIVTNIEHKTTGVAIGCNDATVDPTHDADCDIQESREQDPCKDPEQELVQNLGFQDSVTITTA